MIEGKKILLGVCGSIAAYKSAFLVRLLVGLGAEVKVIMTTSATDFITPLTLATLSKTPVSLDFVKNKEGEWENHVELGLWADLILIAPASANTIAKLANGICDNLLCAVYLSARCPVMLAPAMDLDMYQHLSTVENLSKLQKYGNQILDAEHGELASGLVGQGRMAEPENILEHIKTFFQNKQKLVGKTALVTAGPTHEQIDPVRFIGNNSSGKMGVAIAEVLANQGATVHLISGPGVKDISHEHISSHKVKSADDMYECVNGLFDKVDIAVFAAAVADYKPSTVALQKIKKSDSTMNIELIKNKDIAAEMGKLKKKGQFTVGFALETENEEMNAMEKLKKKNFDMIVLNSLNDNGAGFSLDTNKISIFSVKNEPRHFSLKTKKQVAEDIVDNINEHLNA
ncbi:bifunctional phosphopantothenoylcysteine decarboxylase/phosphopantothenate--cysteine ligase CoaBC [Reichenbachiella sp. MALMAid0571]|uniref:bifunctional phosphopantothenoylcysteine decarboxylase/phosphopantothenate--cysteine ligase CoaBC n=1 Tax=Reichenbachiella sp. MALMAid0571 TaxID=3143939 RepID=UPI0032DE97A2